MKAAPVRQPFTAVNSSAVQNGPNANGANQKAKAPATGYVGAQVVTQGTKYPANSAGIHNPLPTTGVGFGG